MRSGALLVLAVALAGCAAPPPAPPADEPAATRLTLTDCDDMIGRFPRPIDEVRPLVPAPLEPEPFDQTGALGVRFDVALECQAAAPGSNASAPVRAFVRAVAVRAPPHAAARDATGAMLVLDVGANEAWLAQTLAAWGQAPAQHGDVTYATTDGPVRTGRATWGPAVLEVAAPGEEATQPPDHFRFFLQQEGVLTDAIDWRLTEGRVRRGVATDETGAAGTGGHFWGDGYDYELTRVPLDWR